MPIVYRCRHTGYVVGGDNNGMPIVREVPAEFCYDSGLIGDFQGLRHIKYTGGGIPYIATALKCCDEVNQCPKVETEFVPGGVSPELKLHLRDVDNCASSDGKVITLTYCISPDGIDVDQVEYPDCDDILPCADPPPTPPVGCDTCDEVDGHGKWRGSVALRGGIVSFDICCYLNASNELRWRLIFYGNGDDSCVTDVVTGCFDPLFVNFGQINLPNSCDCPNTDNTAHVNVYFVANCHPTVSARHVGYAGGVPIVATENTCVWSGISQLGCRMTCGLVATVTSITDCECMEGTFNLPHVEPSGEWEVTHNNTCTFDANYNLRCTTNLDEDGNPDGTITLLLTVQCGATNTGSDSVVVAEEDMEDLDVTFEIEMTDPSADTGNCGTCDWSWTDMPPPGQWVLSVDNCTGACDCVEPDTPGTVASEIRQTDCASGNPPSCCIGTISVRIMR